MFQEIVASWSLGWVVSVLVGSFIIVKIRDWYIQQRKIKALGGEAPKLKSWLPLGMDIIRAAIHNSIYHRNLENWCQWLGANGPDCHTIETRFGGPLGQRLIFTRDPANVKALLAAQFDDYGKGKAFHDDWEPLLGEGIFATDGEVWRVSRQMIRTQFLKERVSDLGIFEKHSQVLISTIQKYGPGNKIDMFQMFQRFTLDTATEFLFGRSVDNLLTPDVRFAEAFAEVQRMLGVKNRFGPLGALLPTGKLNKQLNVVNDFVEPFIEEVLSMSSAELEDKSKKEYTFLHSLARFTRDRKILRDQIVAVLLAGRDTTASALSWTFYELARHPEVVRKLRKEIVSTIGLDRPPTYADLKNMKYLQNTLNETLRLYPSVPYNVRVALSDTSLPSGGGASKLGPIGILKNDTCIYSTLALHRRQDFYASESDMLNYDPDRWLKWQPKPWDYVPFNGGPRICVGQQYALAEMGFTIVRLLQEFNEVISYMDYDEHARTGWNLQTEVVLQPQKGIWIGLQRS